MYTAALLTLVSVLATGTQAVCSHNTHLFPRSDGPAFGYTGLKGPLNWYSLNVNNTKCSKGKYQSPINLDSGIRTESGAGYELHYPTTAHAKFENLGTTVEVLGDEIGGSLKFGGKEYVLNQFHFHTPSEHRIKEEDYAMELHLVHSSADKHLAVVGFVIQLGANNDPFLHQVLPYITSIPQYGNHTDIGPLNFGALTCTLASNPVYRYKGSLTTPPCSEDVEWIVSKERLTIDWLTFNKAKKIIKFNSRYTQNTLGQINLLENAKTTI